MSFLNIVKKIKHIFYALFSRQYAVYTITIVSIWLCLTMLLASDYINDTRLIPNSIATNDIRAHRDFYEIDESATKYARLEAANKVKNIVAVDSSITEQAIVDIQKTFSIITSVKTNILFPTTEDIKKIAASLPLPLDAKTIETLIIEVDIDEVKSVIEPETINTVRGVMSEGLDERQMQDIIPKLKSNIAQTPKRYAEIIEKVSLAAVRINKVNNWRTVHGEQMRQLITVPPVYIHISRGEIIVRKGEIITPKQIEVLERIGLYSSSSQVSGIISSGLFIFIILLIIFFDTKNFSDKVLWDKRVVMAIGVLIVIVAFICKVATNINTEEITSHDAMYLAPVSIASIMIYRMSNARMAILATMLLSFMVTIFYSKNTTGLIIDNSIGVISMVSGLTAIICFSNVKRRSDMLKASAIAIITNIAISVIMDIMSGEPSQLIWRPAIFSGINSIASCTIAIGSMFFVENLLPVVTSVRLLDIANPSEELLKRLATEAPGTHVHSILVANLAEAGANAINCNALLTRVGAYYHDIGKLKRPSLFIENQFGIFNPHEKLTPTLSTLIIISHVKYGLELAKEHKLPEPVADIIAQHHGTSTIAYFHHEAKKRDGNISEENFKYPGPKPQTKEAAIVMMADSVEAAVRALQNRSSSGVEALVNKIIDSMLRNGQFDECEISFKDISILKKVFIKNIASMYHTRIDYPEKLIKNL